MKNSWNVHKYLAAAVDPLHIGNGGQRLGRVDATVIREPITDIPKIPGTSLSGAIKFFFDLALRNEGKKNICAATCGSDEKNDHDRSKCPVCASFGYTSEKKSMQGILQFSDAMMLAYPVNSVVGPVWITTAPRLHDLCGLGSGLDNVGDDYMLIDKDSSIFTKIKGFEKCLNFGWVVLDRKDADPGLTTSDLQKVKIPAQYAERMIIVSEFVFANLVNSNMEVRTSVVIDPETGAAKTGGLFTYEAVTRGALFVFEVTENDYAGIWNKAEWENKPDSAIQMIQDKAFSGIESVGIGGMTTRGFGRLHIEPMEA